MFSFHTRGFGSKPGQVDAVAKKLKGASKSPVSKGRADCSPSSATHERGVGVGTRVQPAAISHKPGADLAKPCRNRIAHTRLAAVATTSGSVGSLASHEIHLSDSSDREDRPRPRPQPHLPSQPTSDGRAGQQQEQQQRRKQTDGGCNPEGSSWRASRTGPAAALSSRVVAAARRRIKQGLPPAVAVVAPQAPPQAVAAAAAHGPVAAAVGSRAAVAAYPGSGSLLARGWSRLNQGGSSSPVVVVAVLLAAAAAAALSLSALTPAGTAAAAAVHSRAHAVARPVPSVAAPAPAPAGSWASKAPGGGGGGAASAAAGWWARYAVPYMAGGEWLAGATNPAARGSAAATAAAAATAFGRSGGTSGGLWRWSAGRWSAAAGAGSGGGGSGGGGSRHLPTLAVAAGGGGSGAADEPVAAAAAAAGSQLPHHEYEWRESASVRVVTIVSGGAPSPYRTTWDSLADHTAQRLEWTDPSYQMLVFRSDQLGAEEGLQRSFLRALQSGAQVVVGLDVRDAAAEAFLRDPRVASKLPGVVLFLGGSETLARDLTQFQGGLRPQDPGSWRTALARRLTWTPDGRGLELWDTVQLLMGRHDSDNFLFVYLVLINQYVTTVRQVADTTKGFDLQSLYCMIKNCGSKVVGCVQDPTCKSALDCLNACTFNDQVCQYRCIVSYESPLLEQFSLCILQLHNCRNLDAKPPLLPDPAPMPSFRGAPLTHETAEELFFGWLDEPAQGAPAGSLLGERQGKPYSWLVAAGKNPAYDFFPCQHQIYYRGRGRGQVWYEPVFKAITLDGREVWRRRVYRVRRAKTPGTFHLSVLDNGVTSNEYWRVLDCQEDLDYCLFYYSGAASTAGLAYSGAVLGTPDGRMPGPQHTQRLHDALRRAGIEPWELSYVDNSDCGDAPLRITGPVAAAAGAVA